MRGCALYVSFRTTNNQIHFSVSKLQNCYSNVQSWCIKIDSFVCLWFRTLQVAFVVRTLDARAAINLQYLRVWWQASFQQIKMSNTSDSIVLARYSILLSVVHLGITIDAFLNSSIRIKEMCNKGKGIFFSLAHVGVRGHGLNPLTSANIWSKIALPAVTYGCELWKINATNMSELERIQKYVAKAIQSFPVRTHDEIARGMIGWHTLESIINNKKLAFLERTIHLSVYTLSKQMLLIRLYEYYFHSRNQRWEGTFLIHLLS